MAAHERCVRATRHFTAAVLASWGIPAEELDTVVLIVSELSTNAVQHGRSDMAVRFALVGEILRIDVADFGEPMPGLLPSSAHEHGRGLAIVSCLADRTETCKEDWGRRVSVTVRIAGAQYPVETL
ncbi:ATP-binding protein [Streptomyces sp. P5-A9]|uniref:ATP-binding protein n=1 Tax=Streptomyces sp. P5-A9 TaxID=3071730 RepID=UPI002FC851BE